MIEKSLERIADALEKLVVLAEKAPQTTKAEKPKAERPKAERPKAEPVAGNGVDHEVTFATLRDIMGRVIKAKGSDIAKGIIAEHGVEKLSELSEDVYPDVLKAANAALAE